MYPIVTYRKKCEKGLIVNEDKIEKATLAQKSPLGGDLLHQKYMTGIS